MPRPAARRRKTHPDIQSESSAPYETTHCTGHTLPPACIINSACLQTAHQSKAATVPLPLDLLDEGARRLAGLAAAFVVTVIALYLLQRVMQPQIAPLLDDPITRLVALLLRS